MPITPLPTDRDAQSRTLLGLFEQAPCFLCYLGGPELVFELANGAYQRLVGARPLLGKPVREALPELEGQGHLELLERTFATGKPFVGRQLPLMLRPHGAEERFVVDLIYQPIVDADGATVGVLVQGTDVTQLRRSQEQMRSLFESIDDGFCILQMLFDADDRPVDYRFLATNAAFEAHTGLKDPVGKTARELVPDLDESWFQLYGAVALTGQTQRFENHAPAMEGRWFEVYACRMEPPELRQVALVFKNISAKKRTEAKLVESEARFRNMADHAPVMLWVTEASGRCTYLNQQWYAFTGQTEQTGLGLGWLDAVHPEDAARAGDEFLSANATQRPFRLEYRLRNAGGEYRWAIDTASPRFDPSGTFLGYIGSVIDISEHKQAEEEREALLDRERLARAQAEEANRLKDDFLSTVSHELRTPLSAVLGWVQLLRAGGLAEQKRERALETIERNARAQASLIEDLLDVGRILSGKLKLEVEPVRVSRVVEQALDSVRPAAEAKQLRLRTHTEGTGRVSGDAARLQQVVWNLLSNAVKFTPRGGTVEVAVTQHASSVNVEVQDSGVGIAPAFLPHVFERFRQSEPSTTRQVGGLGLGLSIVKHLVEAHGGTVEVSSEGEGRGARFTVTLPTLSDARVEPSPATDAPPPSGERGAAKPPLGLLGLHVLVVEDEPDTRDLLSTLLESHGASVRVTASAEEGLRAVEEAPPDLVISDIGMPGQDGYAFIQKVRALPHGGAARLPAVALTAYARHEDRSRVLRAGYQRHLSKPVDPEQLVATLATLVRSNER